MSFGTLRELDFDGMHRECAFANLLCEFWDLILMECIGNALLRIYYVSFET